jgi:hypothetical protein
MANVLSLFKSRKFWLLVTDTVISMTLWFVNKNNPQALEDVKFLIAAIQPVFITIIGAIAVEDAALSKAG